MTTPRTASRDAPASRGGFTLLELLVVIGIMAILMGLLIGAGVAITRNARANATTGVLTALDRALDEFIVNNSGNIPTFDRASYAAVPGFDGPNGGDPMGTYDPVSDYLNDPKNPMPQRPDASVFIRQARGIGDVDGILAGIPERFLVVTAVPRNATPPPQIKENVFDTAPSVVDAWANDDWPGLQGDATDSAVIEKAWPIRAQSLIYYVHPNNRRNRSDASLDDTPDAQEIYGATVNGRPYFFSAGPDGFYGHPAEGPAIIAHYAMGKSGTESEADFRNRVLLKARQDNLYSTAIDINFRIADAVVESNLWP